MRYWKVYAHTSHNSKNPVYLFNVCEQHKNIALVSDVSKGNLKGYVNFIVSTDSQTEHKCKYCDEVK